MSDFSTSANSFRTRKHSSGMSTARHHQMSLQGDPRVNMFEQVSSDHHQMSLQGMSHRSDGGVPPDLSCGYHTIPFLGYHVTYPMIHLMLPNTTPVNRTDACENITFPQLRLRAITTSQSSKGATDHRFCTLRQRNKEKYTAISGMWPLS